MPALRLALKIVSHSLNCLNVEGDVFCHFCYKVILVQLLPSLSLEIRLYAVPCNEFDGRCGLFHGSSVYGLLVGLAHPYMQSNTVAFYKIRWHIFLWLSKVLIRRNSWRRHRWDRGMLLLVGVIKPVLTPLEDYIYISYNSLCRVYLDAYRLYLWLVARLFAWSCW